jgi:hypothetical protein
MSPINRHLVEQCLIELSSRTDQLRLWRAVGPPEVSSFTEAFEQLFTDSGLDDPLHAGATGFGKECEQLLIELETAMRSINMRLNPDALIATPEMDRVRELATKALVSLQRNSVGGPM